MEDYEDFMTTKLFPSPIFKRIVSISVHPWLFKKHNTTRVQHQKL